MNEKFLPPMQEGRIYELKAVAIRDSARFDKDDKP